MQEVTGRYIGIHISNVERHKLNVWIEWDIAEAFYKMYGIFYFECIRKGYIRQKS